MIPILLILFALPIVAAGVILSARHFPYTSGLVPALLLSGLTGAILTTFFASAFSTAPIAPYELGPYAWGPMLGQVLISIYVGFGLGAMIAAAVGVPVFLIAGRRRAGRAKHASPTSSYGVGSPGK